jgi:two-component system OmpR family sensor kinase
MRKHAVLLTVLFALGVTLLIVSFVFWEFFKLNKQQYVDHIFNRQAVIMQIYRNHLQKKSSLVMLEANLAVYNLLNIDEKNKQKLVLTKSKVLKSREFRKVLESIKLYRRDFYTRRTIRDFTTSMLELNKKIYFYIQGPSRSILILDEQLKPYIYWNLISAYLTIIAIILFSFFLILQRLRPLIRLRKEIALYGDGHMNISFKTTGQDEIALISNELESTKCKINNILESRTLFLRNIMHELKTPIAKGTIATQMLQTPKQIDRFSSIFGRLECLVNEFALIEEVTSLDDKTDFKEYRLVDIIDGAVDMAMIEDESISIDIDASVKIMANYRLYTTAIKNMIDNAIKYSSDEHVKILMIENELSFENKGKQLENTLKYYIEPFTKDNPSKNSFGLGLYLVDSILKAHDRVLAYEYENGINRFIFVQGRVL